MDDFLINAEQSSAGIYIIQDGRFVFISRNAAKYLGYHRKELIGKRALDIVHPENRVDIHNNAIAMLKGTRKEPYEIRIIDNESRIKWVMETVSPIIHKGKRAILGNAMDITEKKTMESTLQESKERYRNIIENITEGYFEVDLAGNVTFFNNALLKIMEYPSTDLNGKNYRSFLDKTDAEKIYQSFNKLFKSNSASMIYSWEFERNGETTYIETSLSVIKDSFGRPIGFRGLARDTTEKHKIHLELKESEERFRLFYQSLLSGVLLHEKGKIFEVNQAMVSLSGYEREELIGMDTAKLVSPEDRILVLQKVLSSGYEKPYEITGLRKDGSKRNLEIQGKPIPYKGRKARIAEVRDVSDRKRLESQFFQAQKLEAVGTLAGGMAHDFNNILMGIQGYTSLMLLGIDVTHPHYEQLKAIEEQVKSASDLTKQLLGYARCGQYEVSPININGVLSKTSAIFGRTKKEIIIKSKFQQNIWIAEVDKGQIEQVLLNLYVNAWQAMPAGGNLYLETQNIEITEETSSVMYNHVAPGRYVQISVTDTGVGMDKKTKARIFEPFFTTKEMGRGSGLGLASAYGIIKSHGGFINVYSEPGKGTTFNIYLPVAISVTIKEEKSTSELRKGSGTILLVDDEHTVIKVISDFLKLIGYRVLTADNTDEAIDIYKEMKNNIDLVILDMIMPGKGGGCVIDAIKKINPDVRIMLSSGYSLTDETKKIMDSGCCSFIQKPYTINDLSQKVCEAMAYEKNKQGN
jgi:two-component system, cell cycle sensor histidine kinase and response regulator CckA